MTINPVSQLQEAKQEWYHNECVETSTDQQQQPQLQRQPQRQERAILSAMMNSQEDQEPTQRLDQIVQNSTIRSRSGPLNLLKSPQSVVGLEEQLSVFHHHQQQRPAPAGRYSLAPRTRATPDATFSSLYMSRSIQLKSQNQGINLASETTDYIFTKSIPMVKTNPEAYPDEIMLPTL